MNFILERKVIYFLILLYIFIFCVVVSFRHYNFETQTWDLAAFVQTMWNTTQGRIMQNNIEEVPNHLGVHMSPFLFLLVPGYLLFPSPYYLLIVQTAALALGAVPLYFFAERVLKKRNIAMLFSAGYLLSPSLHWINLFDFHEIAFFPPFILAAFYYIEKRNWILTSVYMALAASTKEDAILVVIFIGLFLVASSRNLKEETQANPTGFWNAQRKIGIIIAVLAFIYFVLAIYVLMPTFGGGLLRLDRYQELGGSATEIVVNILKNPVLLVWTLFTAQKMSYLFWIFAPLAFLPVASPRSLILLIPGLFENMLTSFEFQFSSLYQYDAILIGSMFIAAVYGSRNILTRFPSKEKLLVLIFAGTISASFLLRSPVSPFMFPTDYFRSNPRREAYREMIRLVPAYASVAAHTNLVPHVSNREHSYKLGREPFAADFVLIDGGDFFGFKNPDEFQAYADSYALSGAYNIRTIQDRYFIFSKKSLTP